MVLASVNAEILEFELVVSPDWIPALDRPFEF
jgi:hypothetical protein